jgi:hypothetical protein
LEQHSENPAPRLVLEPVWELVCEPEAGPAEESSADSTPALAADSTEQPKPNEEVSMPQESPASAWPDDTWRQIIRATRSWIQYGTLGFAVICIVIGALEGLLGR